ncbi:unnamed protein product [Paramecium primaurelia]|uniref:Uncharacterized protein n=1 Tax=Paramecium primaurelia TaxID=5886 RepID=A0A8S1QP11_PARPR|nr:unnamed protein product [Paramecium primaurelia]
MILNSIASIAFLQLKDQLNSIFFKKNIVVRIYFMFLINFLKILTEYPIGNLVNKIENYRYLFYNVNIYYLLFLIPMNVKNNRLSREKQDSYQILY